MGIKVGICGVGSFSQCFIPLFKAHPLVEQVVFCDLQADLLRARCETFEVADACDSLEELLKTDVDAVALFTQNWLHGPQALQALEAGKHVYSAVPSAVTLDEIEALVRCVERTGQIYMVGETSYYYPSAVYCRKRYQSGAFGKIVYAEGEYYHDWDHGLYDVMKRRGGKEWKRFAGIPPMYYPTHSTSMLISVSGAHITKVSCMGWTDRHEDGIYAPGSSCWENPFSNQTALCRMSDGSMFRVNEFRRIGHPGTVGLRVYGTEGSYEEQCGGPEGPAQSRVWVTKDRKQKESLDQLLACTDLPAGKQNSEMAEVTSDDGTHRGASPIQDLARLPKSFVGLSNGHNGTHQFLVDDFVQACASGKQPPNDVWAAARYLVPGLIAHESAKREGALMQVPDFGPRPE